ncbi:MAG: putative toxin-antitoxin system toxin component, PIN family [Nitrospinota bacterium]|nr:putative toxin-antitoxin system toxin component, PIN family [Nitrospinota bacterium]
MRIVLDTNIIISGLLSETGPPGILLKLWLEGRFELLISKAQLGELSRVFEYKKIKERIPPDQAADLLGHIDALAVVIDPLLKINLSTDPDDNAILATAIQSKADFIVSGDKADLLSLENAEGIPILTARLAINHLGKR